MDISGLINKMTFYLNIPFLQIPVPFLQILVQFLWIPVPFLWIPVIPAGMGGAVRSTALLICAPRTQI
jgi:hypothetical protein